MEEYTPDEGREAYEFAADVMGVDLSDYGLVLNSTGSNYIYCDADTFDVIEVCGQRALFTNQRLSLSDIPHGMYLYHLRESDDGGRFATLESRVLVNHGGSVITVRPIDLSERGYIAFTEDTRPNFTGERMTMEELTEYAENEAMGGMQL